MDTRQAVGRTRKAKGAFEYTFPAEAMEDRSGEHAVIAYKTVTPGLIATPKLGKGYAPLNRFTVTQEETGACVLPRSASLSRRAARLVAAALGGVCDWNGSNLTELANRTRAALIDAGMFGWLASFGD